MLSDDKKSVYEENKVLVRQLSDRDGCLVSPIDLSVDLLRPLYLEPLRWINFDSPPAKVKLSNTGETIVVSAKWGHQRPHLVGGPLDSSYVFSQIHFHWGTDEHEGSEHTIRGISYPMEMHIVFFKTRYLSQEAALKKDDGVIIVVYLCKLSAESSSGLRWLASHMDRVVEPHSSKFLPLSPLSALLVPFSKDYLLYWGALATSQCSHTMLWVISRASMAVSVDDLNVFRTMKNSRKEFMNKNFQGANPALGRTIFHVNPSGPTTCLLLPGTVEPPGQPLIVNFNQMPALNQEQARKIFSQGDSSVEEGDNQSIRSNDNICKNPLSALIFCEGTERSGSEDVEAKENCGIEINDVKVPIKLDSKRSSLEDGDGALMKSDVMKRKQEIRKNKIEKYEHLPKKYDSRKVSSESEGNNSCKSDLIKRKPLTKNLLESKIKDVKINPSEKIEDIQLEKQATSTYSTLTRVHPYKKKPIVNNRNNNQANIAKGFKGGPSDLEDLSKGENFKCDEGRCKPSGSIVGELPTQDVKSKLPTSINKTEQKLKSSIAQYFSLPESPPTKEITRKSIPVLKKYTLTEPPTSTKIPRPSVSTIPKPFEKSVCKFNMARETVSKKKSPVSDQN